MSHHDSQFNPAEPTDADAGFPAGRGSVRGGAGGHGARVLCPYCGLVQPVTARCTGCKGLLDGESRQATQNAMGPWFLRNETSPFHPGCSHATLRDLVRRGRISRETILRGPTTNQFWNMAGNTPGVAVLLGECHACHQPAREDEYVCRHCGVVLTPRNDRQHLGLAAVRAIAPPAAMPPVASAGMPVALGITTGPDGAHDAAGTLASPVSVQGAGAGVGVGVEHGSPSLPGFVDDLVVQRASRERSSQRLLLGSAMVLGAGVIVAGSVMVLRSGVAAPPVPVHQEDAAAGATGQASAPAPLPALPTVRFAPELERARKLSEAGSAHDLELAIAELRGVREQARLMVPAPDPAFMRTLDTTIERVSAKLDDAKLNELLGQPAAPEPQPAPAVPTPSR